MTRSQPTESRWPRRLQCFAVVNLRRPGQHYTLVTVCKRFRWHIGPCDRQA